MPDNEDKLTNDNKYMVPDWFVFESTTLVSCWCSLNKPSTSDDVATWVEEDEEDEEDEVGL